MNNMQLLRALGDIDDKFLNLEDKIKNKKEKNSVFFKVKGVIKMGKLVPAVITMILVAYIGVYHINDTKYGENKNENLVADININIANNMMSSDMDVKIENIDEIPDNLKFINNFKIPNELELSNKYRLYTPYDKSDIYIYRLHDYVFSYSLKDSNKSVVISFSQVGKVLKDCIVISDTNKISKIGDIELMISQANNSYFTTFEYNNTYFDITTQNISEDELVELLKSIIVEFKENNIIFGEENREIIVDPQNDPNDNFSVGEPNWNDAK